MKKSIKQLQNECETAAVKLEQYRHKGQRLENRRKYYEKGERTKRTHRLCTIGGTVESLIPEIKEFSKVEIYELLEYIFSIPEVKAAVESAAGKGRR